MFISHTIWYSYFYLVHLVVFCGFVWASSAASCGLMLLPCRPSVVSVWASAASFGLLVLRVSFCYIVWASVASVCAFAALYGLAGVSQRHAPASRAEPECHSRGTKGRMATCLLKKTIQNSILGSRESHSTLKFSTHAHFSAGLEVCKIF